MKESKFYNGDLDHQHPIAALCKKLTTTTTWQLWVHGLLLSWIHSNHKCSHLCFSLSSLCSNWNDLDNSKYVWRQTLLDLTRDSHTHNINNNLKTWLGFFLLYLRQNIKPYTSYELGLSWKILQKNTLHKVWSIKSNFRSIKPCRKWTVIFCNYLIPTLQ